MAESNYQRAARLKFSGYSITGDGPYAVVCSAIGTARLYDFWLLAMNDLGIGHSNRQCSDSHRLIELKPAAAPRPVIFRNPAEMERD